MARRTRKASEDQLAFSFDASRLNPRPTGSRRTLLNKYGALLRRQWEITDPRFVQSLGDPTEHFSQMGEQVQAEIIELQPTLEGSGPAGETYLQKVGRLNAARLQVEENVLAEYQPPSDSSEADEPEGWDTMPDDQQRVGSGRTSRRARSSRR